MVNYHAGQSVVCIDGSEIPGYVEAAPVEGSVYIVRQVRKAPGDILVLTLDGIVNPKRAWDDGFVGEVHFLASRFRPVVKTDISVFEKMLAPVPRVLAPA